MSATRVDTVVLRGFIEAHIVTATPDGTGLITVVIGEGGGQVVQVPDGAVVTGIQLVQNGEVWEADDGWYFLRICAEPGGTAILALENASVNAEYRITAPNTTFTTVPIGNVPVPIAYEAAASRWVAPDTRGLARVGMSMVWLSEGALPDGWLAAGSTVSRTLYSGLFAALGANAGPGDGSTTFDIPIPSALSVGSWMVFAGVT